MSLGRSRENIVRQNGHQAYKHHHRDRRGPRAYVQRRLFGVGGGSLSARLMGQQKSEQARQVSAFSFYGGIGIALLYSLLIGLFCGPVLRFLGASAETIGFASQYTWLVLVLGSVPAMLSAVLANLLRNVGYADKASKGLSMGGLLNIALDPLFMFVLLPKGSEVVGAALATLLSNLVSCAYLVVTYRKAAETAPLSM